MGKFTHSGKFILTIGALDLIAQHAKYKARGHAWGCRPPLDIPEFTWIRRAPGAGGGPTMTNQFSLQPDETVTNKQFNSLSEAPPVRGRGLPPREPSLASSSPALQPTAHAHCLWQVWIKASSEMSFLYGNHVLKSGLGRITENTPQCAPSRRRALGSCRRVRMPREALVRVTAEAPSPVLAGTRASCASA